MSTIRDYFSETDDLECIIFAVENNDEIEPGDGEELPPGQDPEPGDNRDIRQVHVRIGADPDQPDMNIAMAIYVCVKCPRTFKSRRVYRRHVYLHKKNAPMCVYCSKFFRTKKMLAAHLRIKHKKRPADLNNQATPICQVDRMFQNLERLMDIQTREMDRVLYNLEHYNSPFVPN